MLYSLSDKPPFFLDLIVTRFNGKYKKPNPYKNPYLSRRKRNFFRFQWLREECFIHMPLT